MCVFPGAIARSVRPRITSAGHDTTAVVTSGGPGVLSPRVLETNVVTGLPSPSMNSSWFEFCNEPYNLPGLPDGNLLDLPMMGDVVPVPSHTDTQDVDETSEVRVRTEFVSKRFAGIPKAFVEQAQTSFIHRSLMQIHPDPALQDALSVAALYFLRNDSNRLLVIRNLEYKARQLIETTILQIATQASLLAATQALLIYQLIRIFDGDIRLRAQAEAEESVLTTWTNKLRSCMCQLTSRSSGAEGEPSQASSSSEWQSWLMEESIRRTVIMSLMLKGIYGFLKTGHDTVQDLQLSFSAHASLWSAQSRRGWLAKRESGQDLGLRVVHWNEDIAKATAEDFDELGVHIMVMLWGLDATAQWLGNSQLAQHGLGNV